MRRAPAAAAAALLAAGLVACTGSSDGSPSATTAPPSSSPATSAAAGPVEPQVAATVVTGLAVPWGLDFLPDGDAVVTERETARVLRVSPDGEVTELGRVAAAAPVGEGGLLGVAVSPQFETDRSLFVYVTTSVDNRVLRLRLRRGRLVDPQVVVSGIEKAPVHDGGRIAFGPDGHLYVGTGDAGDVSLPQDPRSLNGKILRMTPEGEPAPGNPDPGSLVYSQGHRNVQGLAWDDRGRLWASELGQDQWDELNLVEPGGDHGWPRVEGRSKDDTFVQPQAVWRTNEASPSGIAVADRHVLVASLRGRRLWVVPLENGGVGRPRAALEGGLGRLRTVAVAPDGSVWLTTSNTDGRGRPRDGDDRVLRLTLR